MTKEIAVVLASTGVLLIVVAFIHWRVYRILKAAIGTLRADVLLAGERASMEYDDLRAGVKYEAAALHAKVDTTVGRAEQSLADRVEAGHLYLVTHADNLKAHAEDLRNHAKQIHDTAQANSPIRRTVPTR